MQLAPRGIYCPFITKVEGFRRYKDEIDSGIIEIIGEVSYYVLNSIAYFSSIEGLGDHKFW